MPALPAFKNFITERDPATPIEATSPYDAPLDTWQIGHVLEGEFVVDAGSAALGMAVGMGISAGKSEWLFEFKLMDGDRVSFWQRVRLHFAWTALLFGGFAGGGLDLFTWNFTKEEIDTYVIDGAPTDKHPENPDPQNPAWRYTIGGTELSEFGIAIPGGGPESGNGVGILGGTISSFWQGPLYQNARVAGKAGLDVVRDRRPSARGQTIPLWRIRAIEGADEIDAYFDTFGLLQKAFARQGIVYSSLATLPGRDVERGRVGQGAEPSINEDLAGVSFVGLLAPDQKVYEVESHDTGHTWKRRRRRASETTTETVDVEIWSTGYNMPRVVTLEDGHRGAVSYKNGALWFKTSRDDFKSATHIADVKAQEAYELSVSPSGVYYVSSASGQEYYSEDGGQTWKPTPTPAEST